MKPVFDTNILIDNLIGKKPAKDELDRFPQARISVITWIEVMVGARGTDEERQTREFLNTFEIIPVDNAVAEWTVQLRQRFRLRVPDAIIWASAKAKESILITRNPKDYPAGEPDVRFPYE